MGLLNDEDMNKVSVLLMVAMAENRQVFSLAEHYT
jgi:hypothetical protein